MVNDPDAGETTMPISELNGGALPMSNGLTRLQSRFQAEPERVDQVLAHEARFDTDAADGSRVDHFRAR